jgi:hypothetical protein
MLMGLTQFQAEKVKGQGFGDQNAILKPLKV